MSIHTLYSLIAYISLNHCIVGLYSCCVSYSFTDLCLKHPRRNPNLKGWNLLLNRNDMFILCKTSNLTTLSMKLDMLFRIHNVQS